MGRALIAERNRSFAIRLPRGLSLHQHPQPALRDFEGGFLTCNDIRQFIDNPGQMGNLFFDGCQTWVGFHGVLRRFASR